MQLQDNRCIVELIPKVLLWHASPFQFLFLHIFPSFSGEKRRKANQLRTQLFSNRLVNENGSFESFASSMQIEFQLSTKKKNSRTTLPYHDKRNTYSTPLFPRETEHRIHDRSEEASFNRYSIRQRGETRWWYHYPTPCDKMKHVKAILGYICIIFNHYFFLI